ncbi:MAG: GtrA family protein [Nanoarchaeota archaeon]|nr:GtrA family protein [Nanoarchaeota archaeon]
MNISLEARQDLYKYVKFLFGGGLSLLLNLGITYVLTEVFQLWHMLSFAIALGCEIFFLFAYHSFVTFRKSGKFWLFAIVIICISTLNWLAVYLLTEFLTLPYLIAIVLAAGVISVLNYGLNKRLVFR